jgi:hypothetical protein
MTACERPEHDTHWQQTQVGRATVPQGHPPPPRAHTWRYSPCAGQLNNKQVSQKAKLLVLKRFTTGRYTL